MKALSLAVLAAAASCGGPDDKTAACDLSATSTTSSAIAVQDRKIVGPAAPYVADLGLAARDEELRTSIAARRRVAWEIVGRVLAPVPLAEPRLASTFGGQPTIPAWHTWYAQDDFERMFKKLYRDLGAAGRSALAPIDPAAGFAWNAIALDEIPEWPEQRYLDYLATIDTSEEASGTGNVSRVGYSPGAMAHLLRSYPKQFACRKAAEPAPYEDDPVREGNPVTQRESLEVERCAWRVLGPFLAADGEVVVTSRGTGDADLYVRRGAAPEVTAFDCKSTGDASTETCRVDGAGPVYVAVFGGGSATASVDVEVAYVSADVRDPTCLDGEMPRDAVIIKADWQRVFPGELMNVYDTSGPRLTQRLEGMNTWSPDGGASPPATDIYTVTVPFTQSRFRMPALHVMSKELDHWLWITLWYSPDPDSDFGADRPAAIAALPGPWRNYKMCVTTGYLEGDPDPTGGFTGTLGAALAAVHRRGTDAPTWCSNPYLEEGAGNAATNCIGCHQHGGTTLTAESILANTPLFGTTRIRNNFFTDYLWAVKGGNGDDLSNIVTNEIEYWDQIDP